MVQKFYELPALPYKFNDLEPYISEEQLKIHHEKDHQAYVDGANAILKKFDSRDSTEFDLKVVSKELTFHVVGFVLHNYFWSNMGPSSKCGGEPTGTIAEYIEKDFGSFERFKKEFTQAATSVEGSGWAVRTKLKEITHIYTRIC